MEVKKTNVISKAIFIGLYVGLPYFCFPLGLLLIKSLFSK